MLDIVKQAALLDALTDKQREVLTLVAEGMTSKEIARKLAISESAVNQRIEVIRQKLGGMSRAQIARTYRRTSTLVLTIPTSNSLTGKSNQLMPLDEPEQQSSPEGVEDTVVISGGEFDVLQPSTLHPVFHGRDAKLVRIAAVVFIAVGLLSVLVLVLVAGHTLSQLYPA